MIKKDLLLKQQKSLEWIIKSGYTPKEIKQFIEALHLQKSQVNKNYKVGKNHVKIGVFGDTHIGNINYKPDLMKFYAKETHKQRVDFHLNLGDIFDGWYQNRPTALFEQNAIGFDRQMKMAVEEFSQLKEPLYFITGNHSYNTFVRGAGVEAGPIFESKLKDKGLEVHYLGNGEGDLFLKGNAKIKLLHPDGGTAYALSYRPQKIVESFSGGEKPNILLIGHFHKLMSMFYRNIHVYQTGTFCGQTKFMRGKSIPAHTGFNILDIYSDNKGQISKIVQQLYPTYE